MIVVCAECSRLVPARPFAEDLPCAHLHGMEVWDSRTNKSVYARVPCRLSWPDVQDDTMATYQERILQLEHAWDL